MTTNTGERSLTTRDGLIYFQPDGPGTQVYPVDCTTMGDITENLGGRELIQAFNLGGQYVTKGTTKSAPEMITASLERLLTKSPEWVEKLKMSGCSFPIYVKQQECGVLSDENNFVRLVALGDSQITSITYAGLVHMNEDTMTQLNTELDVTPPLVVSNELTVSRMTFSNANQVNDIAFNTDEECDSNCADTYAIGSRGVAVVNSTGSAKPKVYLTTDSGVTWTAAAADPGAVDDDLAAVTRVLISGGTRVIIGKTAPSGGQGQIFYTDDDGATYSTVSIGGATAGHGTVRGKCLFSIDRTFIWLASAAGYIYKSVDGGVTWSAKESGTITTDDYNFIHFINKRYGIAGSAGDVIALTDNGGDSWYAATATGVGGDILSGWRFDKNRMIVGTDDGDMFLSTDGGTTWTEITNFTGTGVGDITSMMWLDKFTGVISHNNASPVGTLRVTYNGGYSWRNYETPTNAGLNSVWLTNQNLIYAGGQPQGSLGVILKAEAAVLAI